MFLLIIHFCSVNNESNSLGDSSHQTLLLTIAKFVVSFGRFKIIVVTKNAIDYETRPRAVLYFLTKHENDEIQDNSGFIAIPYLYDM